MEIITKSHIDHAHAQSEYFPMAASADGRLSWHSGAEGYISINGRAVYLQYPEADIPAEIVAEMRAFHRAVLDLKEQRHSARLTSERNQMAANSQAREDRTAQAMTEAKRTGRPVYLWTAPCNDPECSIDAVYAMPDGSFNRVHQG